MFLRKSDARGTVDHGWLLAKHSFSFGRYYDPEHMGFSDLLVINEDRVAGGRGFRTHPHANMEIITYVLSGALKHTDSMGSSSVIGPGDVQVMSAGSGVEHSEHNANGGQEVHLLQIWIVPDTKNITPRYAEKTFSDDDKRGRFRLLVSPDGQDGSLSIQQDARLYVALLDGDKSVSVTLPENRYAYVHVVKGRVTVNGQSLDGGDALRITGETHLNFTNAKDAEVLLFDLRPHPGPDRAMLDH